MGKEVFKSIEHEEFKLRLREREILKEINSFTQTGQEINFLSSLFGVGKFRGRKARSIGYAAINAQLTFFEGLRILRKYNSSLNNKELKFNTNLLNGGI